jgi:hypothetical protein
MINFTDPILQQKVHLIVSAYDQQNNNTHLIFNAHLTSTPTENHQVTTARKTGQLSPPLTLKVPIPRTGVPTHTTSHHPTLKNLILRQKVPLGVQLEAPHHNRNLNVAHDLCPFKVFPFCCTTNPNFVQLLFSPRLLEIFMQIVQAIEEVPHVAPLKTQNPVVSVFAQKPHEMSAVVLHHWRSIPQSGGRC